jgi:hypothetical protein
MKRANMILSLESIPKATIYSKYGESLDRMFKSRSLKNLIYELKNPKKINPLEIHDDNKKKKPKYTEEEYKNIFSTVESNIIANRNEELKKDLKKKPVEADKLNHKKITNSLELMDPFKYNPNYDSISKNIPSVRMILTEKEMKELKKKKERQKSSKLNKKLSKINSKIMMPKIDQKNGNDKSFITLLTENDKNKPGINSPEKSEQPLPPITKVPEQKKRVITLENEYANSRNNHALRFSKYLSRKDEYNNKDNINIISYLEPYNYLNNKNNIIDFKKMAYRRERDFINSSSLGVPSFNEYNPKYSLVEKKAAEYVFAPHLNKQNSKQYLIKKLWSSYEVGAEYKLVNNQKLSPKKKLINKKI